jgi:hypothetical protein
MLAILKRELFWFAVSALVLMPAALVAGCLLAGEISPLAAGMNNILLFAVIMGPVFLTEQSLERAGDSVLTEPSARQDAAVWAKFALPLGAAALCAAESLAALRHLGGPADLITLAESSALVTAAAALLAAGLVRLGVFWLGLRRASVVFFVSVMALPVAAAADLGANLGNARVLASRLARFLMIMDRPHFALWAAGIYLLLAPAALLVVHCRRRSP